MMICLYLLHNAIYTCNMLVVCYQYKTVVNVNIIRFNAFIEWYQLRKSSSYFSNCYIDNLSLEYLNYPVKNNYKKTQKYLNETFPQLGINCISDKYIVLWTLCPRTGAKRSGNRKTFIRKYAKKKFFRLYIKCLILMFLSFLSSGCIILSWEGSYKDSKLRCLLCP